MVTTKRKVEMPAGIRNKLMAAVAMLLVATILMVSSTYAWFTLSTAPEVTGISTSIGANGNLEIALLKTETFTNPALISSGAGTSSAAQVVTLANTTWGNLVDLSWPEYGLGTIALQPASSNIGDSGLLDIVKPLQIATYGADGRVATLEPNTVSAIRDKTTGTFKYDGDHPTYGVRAVGSSSNISPRQLTFSSARTQFNNNKNEAGSKLVNAVNANKGVLLSIAAKASAPTEYTAGQVAGFKSMMVGAQDALNCIVSAYAYAGLAAAAAKNSTATDDQVAALSTAISGMTSAETLKSALNTAGVTTYDTVLGTLKTAQESVSTAIGVLSTYVEDGTTDNVPNTPEGNTKTETQLVTDAIEALYVRKDCLDLQGGEVEAADLITTGGSIYVSGGAIGAIADQVGRLALMEQLNVTAYAGTAAQSVGALSAVDGTVSALERPDGEAVSNISDAYGYILDFAFRTNASDSKLQLQTDAVNRVYSDAEDQALATQGAGSNVKFTYSDLNDEQAEKLLSAVKLVFFDPKAGTVYAKASLSEPAASSGMGTAKIVLDKPENTADDEKDDIVSLNPNEPKLVSVLVYLDGELIDNGDVANTSTSGKLEMNLQFSSSATLVPMENTALRNLSASDATVIPAPTTTADLTVTASPASVTAGGTTNVTLSATVGGEAKSATYTLPEAYEGVSISGSTVTISDEAAAGSFTVNGSFVDTDHNNDIHTGTVTITIAAEEP